MQSQMVIWISQVTQVHMELISQSLAILGTVQTIKMEQWDAIQMESSQTNQSVAPTCA